MQVLGMIGETLEDADDILGAVVSIKRGQDRLSVWTKTASDEVRLRFVAVDCMAWVGLRARVDGMCRVALWQLSLSLHVPPQPPHNTTQHNTTQQN